MEPFAASVPRGPHRGAAKRASSGGGSRWSARIGSAKTAGAGGCSRIPGAA